MKLNKSQKHEKENQQFAETFPFVFVNAVALHFNLTKCLRQQINRTYGSGHPDLEYMSVVEILQILS